MVTTALRLYGKNDLRLERMELPPPGEDELLVEIVCDSLCMSTYKAAIQGADHKRVPADVARNPTIVGHELCGRVLEAGARYRARFGAGQKFTLQPAMGGTQLAAGYSFPYLGGNSQYAVIPACYLEQDCVLPYQGEAYFHGALAEPLSCVIGAARAVYHTRRGDYDYAMGIKEGGCAAVLAGAGPMGLALTDYLIHCERRPGLLVVTDIDDGRLDRAAALLDAAEAQRNGVRLLYRNTGGMADPVADLRELTGGDGFDDVFVFAPVAGVMEQGDAILGYDGCLNFFSGPSDPALSARINLYNIHYNATHIMGTSGGNTDDMRVAVELAAAGRINPAILVTHIGGLDAAGDATLRLPELPGGKKLIYNHISMPLTAIADFGASDDGLLRELGEICAAHGGLWNAEAERRLLAGAPRL